MISKKTIDKQLFTSNSPTLPPNFIAAAVYVNEAGKAYHAGFAIGYNGERQLFHFDTEAEMLSFEPLSDKEWYVHKDFITIPPVLASPFLIHCTKIQKLSAPKWGCFFNGCYFKDGVLFNKENDPFYLTCVGFCLAVLLGFEETDDYISFADWTIENSVSDEYITDFLAELQKSHPKINIDNLQENIRRIKPDEYLATAYLNETPIRKATIDKIIPNIKSVIKSRRN